MAYAPGMTRRWVAVVLVAGCTTSGSSSPVEYRRLELPGFSLDAPADVVRASGLDYRSGEVQHRSPTRAIGITWQTGPIFAVEEMPPAIQIIAEQFARGGTVKFGAANPITVGGQKAIRMDGSMDAVEMTFVDVTCGARSVLIAVAGASGVGEARTRLLDSFRCQPVAAEERLLSAAPIGVDDPATLRGWRYTDDDRSTLSITNGESVAVLVELPKTGSIDTEIVRKLLPKLLGTAGATFTPAAQGARETREIGPGQTRVFDRGRLTVEETSLPALVSYWECTGTSRAIVALLMTAEESELTGAIDWLSRIRCSRPGDPPLDIGPPTDVEDDGGTDAKKPPVPER